MTRQSGRVRHAGILLRDVLDDADECSAAVVDGVLLVGDESVLEVVRHSLDVGPRPDDRAVLRFRDDNRLGDELRRRLDLAHKLLGRAALLEEVEQVFPVAIGRR